MSRQSFGVTFTPNNRNIPNNHQLRWDLSPGSGGIRRQTIAFFNVSQWALSIEHIFKIWKHISSSKIFMLNTQVKWLFEKHNTIETTHCTSARLVQYWNNLLTIILQHKLVRYFLMKKCFSDYKNMFNR